MTDAHPYRAGTPPQPPREGLRYGPFARPRRYIKQILLLFLLLETFAVAFLGRSESLTCLRRSDACTATTKVLFVPVRSRRFAISTVSHVDAIPFSSASRASGGYTELRLEDDSRIRVMEVEGSSWRRLSGEISEFFEQESEQLAIASWPRPAVLILLLFFFILAVGLLYPAFRLPSAIELHVLPSGALNVRRRWPGGLSRSETLSLSDVVKIRVVRKSIPGLSKGAPDSPGALLLLVRESGEATAICRDPLPGVEVNHRTAEELRRALNLSEPVEVLE